MKKIILLILVFLITACSQEKVYKMTDTIKYNDISINIIEDNTVTILSNGATDVYLGININNDSATPVTLSQEQWILEVNGERFPNKQVINDFETIASKENRTGTISFSPTQQSDTIYLIINYDHQEFKFKLNNIL